MVKSKGRSDRQGQIIVCVGRPWSVACASSFVGESTVGAAGKTARDGCRGGKFDAPLPEFGVCWMTQIRKGGGDLEAR
eukprot:7918640-Pyramimonas_sp.AAC.1